MDNKKQNGPRRNKWANWAQSLTAKWAQPIFNFCSQKMKNSEKKMLTWQGQPRHHADVLELATSSCWSVRVRHVRFHFTMLRWQCWRCTCPWCSVSSLYAVCKSCEQLIHDDCSRHRSSESVTIFFTVMDYEEDSTTISMNLIDSYLWRFLVCQWPNDNVMYQ